MPWTKKWQNSNLIQAQYADDKTENPCTETEIKKQF